MSEIGVWIRGVLSVRSKTLDSRIVRLVLITLTKLRVRHTLTGMTLFVTLAASVVGFALLSMRLGVGSPVHCR